MEGGLAAAIAAIEVRFYSSSQVNCTGWGLRTCSGELRCIFLAKLVVQEVICKVASPSMWDWLCARETSASHSC
jgi:hypothetical protein